MENKNDENNLFDIQLETENIELPGEVTLKIPKEKEEKVGEKGDIKPPDLMTMPKEGNIPLLAVDIKEGEVPRSGTIYEKPVEEKTESTTGENKIVETEQKKTDEPIEKDKSTTQGQQGSSGEDAESKEKLSPTYLHAAALYESGVLPNLDLQTIKDLKSDEIIDKLLDESRKEVEDQVKFQVDNYKNQFNDDQKRILEMLEHNIPFDDATNVVYNQLRYDSITPEEIKNDPEIQKQLIREFLYAKGHDAQYIERQVKQTEDLERLEDDSIDAHRQLVQIAKDEEKAMLDEAKLREQERKERNKENLEKIKSNINATKEIFKDIPLSDADKKTIIDYMTLPSSEIVRDGQKIPISKRDEKRMENPMEFEKRLAYLIHMGYFDYDKNPTFEKIEKKGETNAVGKLKEIMRTEGSPKAGSPTISKDDEKNVQGKNAPTKFFLPSEINTVRHRE
jgi:hypothetical protein